VPSFPTRARALAAACGIIALFAATAIARPDRDRHAERTAATVAAPVKAPADREAPRAHVARRVHHHRRRALRRPLRRLRLSAHGRALLPRRAPHRVRRLIRAANRIAHTPYVWGGGHGDWRAAGYDCSGSVSYALHAAGLLDTPQTSGALAAYGRGGKGRWVTIYANGGHAYMEVAGARYDTSARSVAGSRWTREGRGDNGFVARHPAGP